MASLSEASDELRAAVKELRRSIQRTRKREWLAFFAFGLLVGFAVAFLRSDFG